MDSIESVDFDVDAIDGPHGETITQATLYLEGDFSTTCQEYLDAEEDSVNYTLLAFRIDRNVAEQLVDKIGRYLA
jgi:hypothetical protein